MDRRFKIGDKVINKETGAIAMIFSVGEFSYRIRYIESNVEKIVPIKYGTETDSIIGFYVEDTSLMDWMNNK